MPFAFIFYIKLKKYIFSDSFGDKHTKSVKILKTTMTSKISSVCKKIIFFWTSASSPSKRTKRKERVPSFSLHNHNHNNDNNNNNNNNNSGSDNNNDKNNSNKND